jgi:hypothetical protein
MHLANGVLKEPKLQVYQVDDLGLLLPVTATTRDGVGSAVAGLRDFGLKVFSGSCTRLHTNTQ